MKMIKNLLSFIINQIKEINREADKVASLRKNAYQQQAYNNMALDLQQELYFALSGKSYSILAPWKSFQDVGIYSISERTIEFELNAIIKCSQTGLKNIVQRMNRDLKTVRMQLWRQYGIEWLSYYHPYISRGICIENACFITDTSVLISVVIN